MKNRSFNYVRTFRKRHALSCCELAFLLGQRSDRSIYAYEHGERVPTLEVALMLQVLFGQVPHQLFPGLYEVAEEKVMARAAKMLRHIEGRGDRRSMAKRELLESLPGRDANDFGL